MTKGLTGDVASIKLLGPDDAAEYLHVLRRNREFMKPYEPLRPDAYWTLEGQHEQLEQAAREAEAGTGYAFGIYDADGALAGRVALANIVRKAWQNATLGYWVDGERNGRGLATAASKLALRFAFEEAGCHRVQAGVMPRNARSIRVIEKIGMRFEGVVERYLLINGVWEDHQMYAVTVEEWKP
jgi:[ribosomal protein S5]-alanine N-acetyltransferase